MRTFPWTFPERRWRPGRPGTALRSVLGVAAAFLVGLPPASAQIFDFDNVVMLANRDLFLGYNDVWGFVGTDGREYVIQGLTTGTAWWDIEDPVNPVLVEVIPGPSSGWRDMFVIGDWCYVGTEGGGGIQIIDISNPASPTLANVYNATVGQSHNIFGDVDRKLIYAIGGYTDGVGGGIQVFDASDPVNLVEIDRWTNHYVHDLSIRGNLVFACLFNVGRMKIFDATDPSNLVSFGTAFPDPTGAVHASWPLENGTHVMVAEETGGGHLKCLDYSVPTNITIASIHNPAPAASIHNVHVEGDKTFCSWYARGTRILDSTDPTNLFEIGYWDTYPESDGGGVGPGNWGVYPHLPSGVIVANDRPNGLFLLKYDPDAGTLGGTVSSSEGGVLDGATAEYENLNITQLTDAGGNYKFAGFPGSANKIRFSSFGFEPDSITVNLPADATTTTHMTLTKLPSGGLSGVITDLDTLLPVEGVEVLLLGTPLAMTTDASGTYSFPDVPSDPYSLRLLRYGYAVPEDVPLVVQTGLVTSLDVQLEPAPVFVDFSDPTGWSVVDDVSASSPDSARGSWVFAEPFGTYAGGFSIQTEFDHTLDPENQCAVTGNAAAGNPNADDVDSLTTRLISPVYDLSAMAEPHAFYYRWYAVDVEEEPFEVEVTSDGGSNWAVIESTSASARSWTGVDVDLTGLLGSWGAVQFRFTAQDPDNSRLVEAALDDFAIYDAGSAVGAPHLPGPRAKLELSQSFPNPFDARTTVRFAIPSQTYVELSVFDVRGARVAVLVDGVLEPGSHVAVWDGRTVSGGRAADGVYFTKLWTSTETRTRKMVRLN